MKCGIIGCEMWQAIERIEKGWSSDTKYQVTQADGTKLLLRVADVKQAAAKQQEYAMLQRFAQTGIELSQPVAFGVCEDGAHVYQLLTWIEGVDLQACLPTRSVSEQYALGRLAGTLLKRLHSVPLTQADVAVNRQAHKLRQLAVYEAANVRVAGDEVAVAYVKAHIDQLMAERTVCLHGDFHPGNLIYTPNGSIGVIDFNRWKIGDPYEEFYKLESFGIETSIPYCVGQIDGYFADAVPLAFWQAQAVYVAHAALYSIVWAQPFGEAEVAAMVQRYERSLANYAHFTTLIPKWYRDYHGMKGT